MSKARPASGGSLGVRLSVRLAAQTFLGLAAVSLLAFLAIRAHLIAREGRALDEMQALVVHLVEEAAVTPRAEGLEHALRDQFAGREEARLELFDAAGRPRLARTAGDEAYGGAIPPLPDGRVRVREFVLPTPHGLDEGTGPLRARLSLSTARDDALLARLAGTLAAGTLLGTLFVSAAAFWRVRRELGSVGRLVAQIDALDAERLGRRERLDGDEQPSELRPLIGQFNELLDRLDASYQQMAAFNADVAHELNTPLATLITSNEIAARSGAGTAAAREELIGSNLEELQRLRGIVRDMLFLSTAERGARARRRFVPSLATELHEVIDYHEAALEEAALTASVVGEASVDVDVALVRRAVSNLIGNATRYAVRGSCIEVIVEAVAGSEPAPREADRMARGTLSAARVADAPPCVRIAVTNHGATIAPRHLERLFDRFYRIDEHGEPPVGEPPVGAALEASDRAERSRVEGEASVSFRHGLGLSIVAAIARMHGGHPFARSEYELTTIGFTLASEPSSRPFGDEPHAERTA